MATTPRADGDDHPRSPPLTTGPPPRRGRKRDHSRDPAILEATLDVLARTGYDGMSIDVVAGEAQVSKGLVYRRWPTKEQLALAAITSLGDPLEPDGLPDTGQLRGDLFALVDSRWLGGTERRIATLAGLGSVLTSSPTLADAIHHQIAEPYVAAYRALLSRAVQRGEIPPGTDVDILAETIPALSTHRLMVQNGPLDRAFYESVIDHVVLAAVGLPSAP